jgi:hypothetical protein
MSGETLPWDSTVTDLYDSIKLKVSQSPKIKTISIRIFKLSRVPKSMSIPVRTLLSVGMMAEVKKEVERILKSDD